MLKIRNNIITLFIGLLVLLIPSFGNWARLHPGNCRNKTYHP